MKISYFDPKTGQPLLDSVNGAAEQRYKDVPHSFLEHWLDQHGLSKDDFWVGSAYPSDHARHLDTTLEQERLESEGKYLVFTNGKDGYFTNAEMAQLLSEGDGERGIGPIFASGQTNPHNSVAYGSLISSDGVSSTQLGGSNPARILVIDDEQRRHGEDPLLNRQGQPISPQSLTKLYDKIGDGTMLVSSAVMRSLVTDSEREHLMSQAMDKAGISESLTELGDTHAIDEAVADGEKRIERFSQRLVTQFRAASTDADFPGIAKGTMQTSRWVDELGVDAIISRNDIKGDDGRFSTPGLHQLNDFWINRKSDATYGSQTVGPQVKGTIPEATLHEFNPRMKQQAESLAAVASDPKQLLEYYVAQKERQQRLQPEDGLGEKEDWIYETAKHDKYGLLNQFSKLNRGLNRALRQERTDVATHGIRVPSAMAQHHSQLKPWEVANKDLPQDAIVAYYRSPFPNVGAAAIAINNPAALNVADSEAYHKHGVAYLNPDTAKNVAITDFDSDRNGFFVGYLAQEPGLAAQVREQLSGNDGLSPSEQYEAGRSLFAEWIEQSEQSPAQSAIRPATPEEGYPLAVKEFVERNAPERKPAEVKKQPKQKHPWDEGESRYRATYRAWQITANNPTGKVANAGMTLQSLAAQTQYVPEEKKEGLLLRVSKHYQGVMEGVRKGNVKLPSDTQLNAQGFPPYGLEARIESLADAAKELKSIQSPDARAAFIQGKLDETHSLLSDIVDGPNAVNLQTAVDVAKSARGIDESIHSLAKVLAYQEDALRESHKDPTLFTSGKLMPSNIDDPINWGVQQANALYKDSELPELPNETFKEVFPKTYTPEQERKALPIAQTYNAMNAQAADARDRLRSRAKRDAQPTLTITSPSGNSVQVENLLESDPSQELPIWRADGQTYRGAELVLKRDATNGVDAFLKQEGTLYDLCPISRESIKEHELVQRLGGNGQIVFKDPTITVNPAYAIQNDSELLFEQAASYLDESIDGIDEEERADYASALWRHSEGMGVVLKKMTPEFAERMQQPIPPITVIGLQYYEQEHGPLESGEYKLKFDEKPYTTKGGESKIKPGAFLVGEDGTEIKLGGLGNRDIRPAQGTVVIADIQRTDTGKQAGKTAIITVKDVVSEQALEADAISPSPSEPSSPASYHPSIAEVRGWYREAQENGHHDNLEQALQMGMALREQFKVGEGEGTPPSDYRHASVRLSMEELNRFQSSPQVPYQPSRGELSQWYQSAAAQQDGAKLETIKTLGQTLSSHYSSVNGEKPPHDYRHPSVTLTSSQREQMKSDIAAHHASFATVSSAERPAQR